MAVPFTQMATEALYWHSKELTDLISTNIAAVGMLGARNRIKIITGGRGWNERVYYGDDPNAGHGSRYTQIGTQRLENMTMAQYDKAFFRTSVVVNKVDVAEAKGEWALGDLVQDSWEVAKTYAVKKIGQDLWASSQTNSNYPIPIRVFLPDTLPASQTGTTRGGISSTDNAWWRSQAYTTAISDLGAAAGLRILQQEMNKASRNASRKARPDIGLTTSALYTRITSTMDQNRRFVSESDLKLGFDYVSYLGMLISWDAECPDKHFYGINSNTMKIKCLKMPYMQNVAVNDKQLSLPMVIEPMRDDIDTINNVSLMYLPYQLTCNDLASNMVLTNCTE